MIAGEMNNHGRGDDRVHEFRSSCERCLDALGELARIHLAVDYPPAVWRRMNRIGSAACGRYAFT